MTQALFLLACPDNSAVNGLTEMTQQSDVLNRKYTKFRTSAVMCLSGGSLNTALNPVMYLTSSIETQYSDVLNLTLNL